MEVATGKPSPWELDGQNRSEPVVCVSYSKAKKNGPAGLSFDSSSRLFWGAVTSKLAFDAPSSNTHPAAIHRMTAQASPTMML